MFWLAETLGRTVGELEATMSAAEFTEWSEWLKFKADEQEKAREKLSHH